jgi:hypothetical protein
MNRYLMAVLAILFVTACVAPTAAAPAARGQVTPEPAAATATRSDAPSATTEPSTPEPDPTSTPVAEAPRRYWALGYQTDEIFLVDSSGAKFDIGSIPPEETKDYKFMLLGGDRALLFTIDQQEQLHLYLMTPDEKKPIKLPPDLRWRPQGSVSLFSFTLAGRYGDRLAIACANHQSVGGDNGGYPDTGPLFLVDLQTLTSKVLDRDANRDTHFAGSEAWVWFHASADGRYLRYINGQWDQEKQIHEADLATGEVRTLYKTRGYPNRMSASPEGDLWFLPGSNVILNLDGQTVAMDAKKKIFFALGNGLGGTTDRNCANPCRIEVGAPFGGADGATYSLPWEYWGYFFPRMTRLTADGSLMFVGAEPSFLDQQPELVQQYPAWDENSDLPVFRLSPDGSSRLVGLYVHSGEFDKFPISPDGRYSILKSLDGKNLFIYDSEADRTLSEMSTLPETEYIESLVLFTEAGIVIERTAAFGSDTYRSYYHFHSFQTGKSYSWDDAAGLLYGCIDILPGDRLVCSKYTDDLNSTDMVLFDPATQQVTTLAEGGEFVQSFWR